MSISHPISQMLLLIFMAFPAKSFPWIKSHVASLRGQFLFGKLGLSCELLMGIQKQPKSGADKIAVLGKLPAHLIITKKPKKKAQLKSSTSAPLRSTEDTVIIMKDEVLSFPANI